MNIESSNINRTQETQTSKTSKTTSKDLSTSFADELQGGINNEVNKQEDVKTENIKQETVDSTEKESGNKETDNAPLEIESTQDNLTKAEGEELGKALEGLNLIVQEFNQSEDKLTGFIKNEENPADNNTVINKDYNIQENKDILPQMNPNMNFSGDGQPFSSFMNNDSEQNKNANKVLSSSAQDLAEEAAILSTMTENIAIANRNQALKDAQTTTTIKGVKRVDSQAGIKIETVIKFDTVIMNQADVEVFANLVENGEVNLNNLAPKSAEKSIQISKTLADMLAKSMENNKPVRINFDNNISIIIRISREGKITADFLPSSQVAEAYLKENLPLLRQRFDDNNIEYDSLNQRERREHQKENNKKKDRNNE